jgi:hypothetical protein
MSEQQNRENRNAVFSQDTPSTSEALTSQQMRSMGAKSQRDSVLEELGIQIPEEVVPLPSQGKVYPVGSPLHKRNLLEIKPMTAKEEDILTSRAYIKKGTVITKLIQSCVTDRSVNVQSMLSGDRNAVLVAIRITGYGAQYSATITCPECNENFSSDFDLSQLPLKNLEIEPAEPGVNLFDFQLPVTQASVQFKFLTGRDEEEITVNAERRKKKLKSAEENMITARLQHQIVSVNGRTEKGLISKFIQHMPAGDSLALRNFIQKHEPGIDMVSEATCTNIDCGEISEVDVPLGASFFWPDTRK